MLEIEPEFCWVQLEGYFDSEELLVSLLLCCMDLDRGYDTMQRG